MNIKTVILVLISTLLLQICSSKLHEKRDILITDPVTYTLSAPMAETPSAHVSSEPELSISPTKTPKPLLKPQVQSRQPRKSSTRAGFKNNPESLGPCNQSSSEGRLQSGGKTKYSPETFPDGYFNGIQVAPTSLSPDPEDNLKTLPSAVSESIAEASISPDVSASTGAEFAGEDSDNVKLELAQPSITPSAAVYDMPSSTPFVEDNYGLSPSVSGRPVSVEDLPLMSRTPDVFPVPRATMKAEVPFTPTITAAPSKSSAPKPAACFPADGKVRLANGTVKRMDEVSIGDLVQVGNGVASEVFMFTHKTADVQHEFLRLSISSGTAVELTEGHYLPVNGVLMAARSARVGDEVALANGTRGRIVHVSSVAKKGLYNPQTMHGNIVVNGVVASTYTEAVSPRIAHALLAPLRIAHKFTSIDFHAFESKGHFLEHLFPKSSSIFY